MADTIKLYSWNVNGLRAVLRKGALQAFLKEHNPDILCLQEIKCKPDQLDLFESDALKNYEVFWNPAEKPGYSGTAILLGKKIMMTSCSVSCPTLQTPAVKITTFTKRARGDVVDERRTKCCDLDDCGASRFSGEERQRRQPRTKTECEVISQHEGRVLVLDCGGFYLVNVYTPNSKPDLSRLKLRHDSWDPEFKEMLKELEKEKPVVTCGDFNCAHEEIDLARPKQNHHNAGFTDEEREGVTNLINAGFIDAFRSKHPKAERYTWWSHWGKARENNVGWRIDYFFISKSMKEKLKDAEIYEAQTGSDHCPISITLEIN